MTQAADDPVLLVHAYCDGELDPANALALERRMAEDPRLAAERDRILALKRALAKIKPAALPPAALRGRVERAVGMRRAAPRPTWGAVAASIALAAVVSSGATWSLLGPTQSALVSDEVLGSHISALIADRPYDVASSDQHTVKPWFNSHTIESPRVVDLKDDGFPLLGGRIDVIAKTPVPTLVYGYQKHRISVTETQGLGAPPAARETGGYHLIGWTDGGVSYWAVSDVGLGELQQFVKLFRAAPTSQ
ncbi:MAG TPA: anti-sigma factor [Xanthobacteraceae bacterium]|nr:anti-sigma factor [Xanthobacteraceae bacterium]